MCLDSNMFAHAFRKRVKETGKQIRCHDCRRLYDVKHDNSYIALSMKCVEDDWTYFCSAICVLRFLQCKDGANQLVWLPFHKIINDNPWNIAPCRTCDRNKDLVDVAQNVGSDLENTVPPGQWEKHWERIIHEHILATEADYIHPFTSAIGWGGWFGPFDGEAVFCSLKCLVEYFTDGNGKDYLASVPVEELIKV